MNRLARRIALAALVAAPFATASPAAAQTPTPEGTVITNTATASFTDANGNSYTNVQASVSVTVGFLPGVDVSSPATVTPASPSTGNELAFTITNPGNGVDSVSVSTTAGSGVTITGYKIGSTTYTTLGELNEALAGIAVPAGSSVTVTVVYTVAPGQGGQTIPVELTATSRRAPGTSDASTTNVQPPVATGVTVTPDNQNVDRLPSNGTQYTQTYTVTNTGNASDTFTLTSAGGSLLTVVSTNGTAGTGSSITLAAGGSTTISVIYTVGQAAAGTQELLTLTATSTTSGSTTDQGSYNIRVIRAALSMTKQVFRDNQTTAITSSDRVLPGEYIWYRITVTNTGGAAASTVSVSDPLPSEVQFVSTASDATGWTIGESAGTVSASLSGTLAPAASRFFWIRVRVR